MPRKKKEVQSSVQIESGGIVSIGALLCYYLDGWRTGHLISITGQTAKVQPIGPRNGAAPRAVTVSVTDLKEA